LDGVREQDCLEEHGPSQHKRRKTDEASAPKHQKRRLLEEDVVWEPIAVKNERHRHSEVEDGEIRSSKEPAADQVSDDLLASEEDLIVDNDQAVQEQCEERTVTENSWVEPRCFKRLQIAAGFATTNYMTLEKYRSLRAEQDKKKLDLERKKLHIAHLMS